VGYEERAALGMVLRQQQHAGPSTQAAFRQTGARDLTDVASTAVLCFRGAPAHNPETIPKCLLMLHPVLGSRDSFGDKISTSLLWSLGECSSSSTTKCPDLLQHLAGG